MLTLPQTIAIVIGAFAPMFSKRIFEHAKLLVVGAILAPGKRTVTSVLSVMGKNHAQLDCCPFERAEVGRETARAVFLGVLVMPRAPGHTGSFFGAVSGVLRTPVVSQVFEKTIVAR